MDAAEVKQRVPIENVVAHYGGILNAKGECQCLLPHNHNNGDSNPSMTVRNGRVRCWSQQCFGEKGADQFELVGVMEGLSNFSEQRRRVCEIGGVADTGNGNGQRRIVSEYPYTDEDGHLLFQVVRYEPKDFRQRRPDGKGGWIANLQGVPLVLYRLPSVLAAQTVLLVEGEKDADTAHRLGLPDGYAASCNPMGAGKWKDEYSDSLTGKMVVILPDADPVGLQHGHRIAAALQGHAAAVHWLTLPGGAKDLTAWAESGGTQADLYALLTDAPNWTPPAETTPEVPTPPASRTLAFTSLAALLSEPDEKLDFLVGELLPTGGFCILNGKPKAGKSTLARVLALAVARGDEWLGLQTHQGPVLYLGLEEKRAEVRKHFAAMGATADPVYVFIAPSPEDGLLQLRSAAAFYKPVLIIVDPIFRFVRVKDGNDYAQMTAALEPIMTLARDTGATVLGVHHLGKGDRSGGDAILGSTAIFGSVDSALFLKRSDRYRTLSSQQRYGTDLEEITLTLDPDTHLVTAGLPRLEADISHAMTLILDFLRTLSSPTDAKTIYAGAECRKEVAIQGLKRLMEQGKVTRTGRGGGKDPFRHAITDSGSVVPSIYQEPGNQSPRQELTTENHLADRGSQLFETYAPVPDTQEPDSEEDIRL